MSSGQMDGQTWGEREEEGKKKKWRKGGETKLSPLLKKQKQKLT